MLKYLPIFLLIGFFALTSAPIIAMIRRKTVDGRAFILLILNVQASILILFALELWQIGHGYVDESSTDPVLLFLNPLEIDATILFATYTLALVFRMVRTRRLMRESWSTAVGKPTIPLADIMHAPPGVSTIRLPFRIQTRIVWRAFAKIHVVVDGMLILFLVVVFIFDRGDASLEVVSMISLFITILLFIVVNLLVALRMRDDLLINNDGLSQRGARLIPWAGIRLFALLKDDVFEVSTPHQLIRFKRLSEHHQYYVPATSYAEYQHQIGEVLMLIAERTQLPLSDLRDREPF